MLAHVPAAILDLTGEKLMSHNFPASKSKRGLGGPNIRRVAAEVVVCGFFVGYVQGVPEMDTPL